MSSAIFVVVQIRIPVAVVTNITKKKTAIIIPNAIRVNTETNKVQRRTVRPVYS